MKMEKYITDERTGLNYELVGDYYLIAGDKEPEREPIGIWGLQHAKYLREHKHAIYSGLLISGKLDSYLRDIDRQAEQMFSQLVLQMTEQKGIIRSRRRIFGCQRAAEDFPSYPLIGEF